MGHNRPLSPDLNPLKPVPFFEPVSLPIMVQDSLVRVNRSHQFINDVSVVVTLSDFPRSHKDHS